MASLPLSAGPASSLSNFQFKTIGRQPSLLSRMSAPTNTFIADMRLSSPESPLEDQDEVRPEVSGSNTTSVSFTRPSLFQALSSDPDVPMSDSTVPAKGTEKVNIPAPAQNTTDSPSNTDKSNSHSARRVSHITARSQASASAVPLNNIQDSIGSASPRLQYPTGGKEDGHSQLHTPMRSPSPLSIKKELSQSGSKAHLHNTSDVASNNIDSSAPPMISSQSGPSSPPVTCSEQSAIATLPASTASQATPSPFASLKNMHARLLSSLSSLSQSASDSSNSTTGSDSISLTQEVSESQDRSMSNAIASALSLTKHAHTLAQRSLSSAEEASKVASTSLSAAKESLDAVTQATNMIEEAAISVDAKAVLWSQKEIELKEKAAELRADLNRLGEWIQERERERARRLQLREQEAKEKQEREAAEAALRANAPIRVDAGTQSDVQTVAGVADVSMTDVPVSVATSNAQPRQSRDDHGSQGEASSSTPSISPPVDEFIRYDEEALRELREVEAAAKRARENAENKLEQRRREEERRRRAAEEEEERRHQAAEKERQKQTAQLRKQLIAEHEERRRIAVEKEAECRRQVELEKTMKAVKAERHRRLQEECQRQAKEEAERQKAVAEETERCRLQAQEAERRRKAAREPLSVDIAKGDSAERTLRQEIEARAEQERRRAEISEAKKIDQHETALKIRADRARRAGSAASPDAEVSPATTVPPWNSRTSTPIISPCSSSRPNALSAGSSASPPAQVQDVADRPNSAASTSPGLKGTKMSKKERKRAAAREQQERASAISGGVKLGTDAPASTAPLRVKDHTGAVTPAESQELSASDTQRISSTAIPRSAPHSQVNHSQPQHGSPSARSLDSATLPVIHDSYADRTIPPISPLSPISSDVHAPNVRSAKQVKNSRSVGATEKKQKGQPAPADNKSGIKKEKEEEEEDASLILQQALGDTHSSSTAQTASQLAPASVSHPPLGSSTRGAAGPAVPSEGHSSVIPPLVQNAAPSQGISNNRGTGVAAMVPGSMQPLPPRPVTTFSPIVDVSAPSSRSRVDNLHTNVVSPVVPQSHPHSSTDELRERVLRDSPISPDPQGDGGWNNTRETEDAGFPGTINNALSQHEPHSGREAYSHRIRRGYDHYSPHPSRSPSPPANYSTRPYRDNIRARSPYARSPPPHSPVSVSPIATQTSLPRRYSNATSGARDDRYIPTQSRDRNERRYTPPEYRRRNESPPSPLPSPSYSGIKRARELDQTDLPPARRSFNRSPEHNHSRPEEWPASSYYLPPPPPPPPPPRVYKSPPSRDSHSSTLESRLERPQPNYTTSPNMPEHGSYDGTTQAENQRPRATANTNKSRQNWSQQQEGSNNANTRTGLLGRLGNAPQQPQSGGSGGAVKPRPLRGQGRGRGRGAAPGGGTGSRQLSQRLQPTSNALLNRMEDGPWHG